MNERNLFESKNISTQILEKLNEESSAKELYEHHKNGGKCNGWTCNPVIMDELSKKLAEKNIPHTYISGNDGTVMLVSRDCDKEDIRDARQSVIRDAKVLSEQSLNQIKAKNIGGRIHTISGVSEAYMTVFKNEAKKTRLDIAISDNKDGTYDIHYASKDKAKAEPVIMETISQTKGTLGRFNELRILAENKSEKDIYNSIINPNKEFYVVSPVQPKEYMHFTHSGYEHYRNGQLIGDELRSNSKFQIDSHNKIASSFIKPIVLTKEEFEETKKMSREEYISHLSARRKIETPNLEDLRRIELERMARQIAEYKMSYENNELNTNFYDKTVTVSTFENIEHITDKQIDRESEMSISNPKALSPEIQTTIDKTQSLPIEDREYIDERVKEYMHEVRQTKEDIIVTEVTKEDLNQDIDVMLSYISENRYSTELNITTEERERE